MFKKQARAWSAILVVCMLLSLLATFALPVSAEGEPTLYFDEVVSETGLIDTTNFKDISDYDDSTKVYKVSDRAGLEKLNSLVLGGKTLAGVTIYQAADIDLKWENFPGIGATGKLFSGTYNGNGFTIDGLYVQNAGAEGAGLFNDAKAATFWNIAISSGLIIGGMRAGSIVGGYESHANLTFYNCWSAATVVGGGKNGTGGLAGTSIETSAFYNCYFLGMVYSRDPYPGGITGYVEAGFHMENTFNYGEVITGVKLANSISYADGIHTVMICPSTKTLGTVGVNNFYRKSGRMKSTYDSFVVNSVDTTNDNAVGYSAEAFANGEVVAKLNGPLGHPTVGQVDEYIMCFTQSEAGYPVATYLDNETLEPIVKRTAHTTTNIGKNTLAEKSELFRYVSENLGNFPSNAKLGNYEIDNAYDLFAMSLLTSFRGKSNATTCFKDLGLTGITFTADIDMAEMKDLFPIDNFLPMGSTNPFSIPVDGQGHVIKNWKTVTYVLPQIVNDDPYANAYTQAGFIAMGAGKISDLGLVDAQVVLDYQLESTGTANPAGGLLVGYQGGSLEIANSFATGEVIVRNAKIMNDKNGQITNEKMGALIGYGADGTAVIKSSWADAKLKLEYADAPFSERKLTAYGSTDAAGLAEENVQSVYYFADTNETSYGSAVTGQYQKRLTGADDLKMVAVNMNQVSGKAAWGIENNKIAFATDENAVVGVYYQKVGVSGYKGGAPEIQVVKPGDVVTLPVIENYEPNPASYPDGVENGKFVMPSRNVEIQYVANTFDKDLVQSIYNRYNGMDEVLFTSETVGALRNIKNYAKYLLENTENAAKDDLFNLQAELEELVMNAKLELVAVYPNIPAYSDYELLKDYNTSGVWGISSKEDWIALTNVPVTAFDAKIELHLTQNINMMNVATLPMYYGGTFSGIIDGHGYAFENLNVTMSDTNTGIAIGGLVAQMKNATIRDLGVKSGIVKITNHQPTSDNHGVGVISGYSTNSTLTRVWVGEDVTLDLTDCKQNSSYGVLVGRGANVFESCYSYCYIKSSGTPNHVSHMGDWINAASGQLSNCYAVTNSNGIASIYMYRGNSTVNNVQTANNLWIVGGTDVKNSSTTTIAANSGQLPAGSEANGALAYSLWANYVEGQGGRNYFTVKDNKTVVGTKEEQYYRLRISKGFLHTDYYGKAGDVIDIASYGLTADCFEKVEGSVGTLEGLKVTMGEGDMNLKVINPNGANLYALDEVLERYKVYGSESYISDFSFFVNGAALKEKFDDVIAKYATYTKEDQAEIDAAVEFLKDGYVLDETIKVPASYSKDFCKVEGNDTYTEVGIYNLTDLKFVEANASTYSSNQTIFLCNNLDLVGSGFTTIEKMVAKFDGQEFVISGLNTNLSFFTNICTTSIKNMVFKNCYPSLTGDGCGLVAGIQDKNNITTTLENILVEDCEITRPSGAGVSAVYGSTFKKSNVVLNNITVRNTKILNNEGGQPIGRSAMIISQIHGSGSVKMNNILVEGCSNKNGFYDNAGLVFGTMSDANNSSLTMNGVIVRDSTIAAGYVGTDGVLGNAVGSPYNKVVMSNVAVYNNNVGKAGLIGGLEEDNYVNVTATDVYTDVAVHYANKPLDGVWVYETDRFQTGELAYLHNQKLDDPIYAMNADGGMIFASETNAAPVKINITVNGATNFAAYTDGSGKLAFWDHILNQIDERWPDMPCTWECCENGDPLAHSYTEDGVLNVRIDGANKDYTCNHKWQHEYVSEGLHKYRCEYCGEEGMARCMVKWSNDGVHHTGTCINCRKYYADENCMWEVIGVNETGCETPRSEEHQCTVCGYVKTVTSRLSKGSGHALKYEHNPEKPGTHYVVCENGCGLNQLDNCIEESYIVIEPTTESPGYTEWTCGVCGGKWQQNHINAIATVELGNAALLDGGRETVAKVELSVNGDPGMSEMTFTVQYSAADLAFKAVATKDATIAAAHIVSDVPGAVTISVVANDGKTTKVSGALLELEFDLLNTTEHKQYDLVLKDDIAAIANGKSTPVTVSEVVGYVRVISDKDLNTDLEITNLDLIDLMRHLLEKEPSSPVREDLADINGDTKVNLLDTVDLARLLSEGVYR